ncbi:MAG: hypothetical protein ACYDIE_02430 [Candidatus Krumholzibacteriia bacterium]
MNRIPAGVGVIVAMAAAITVVGALDRAGAGNAATAKTQPPRFETLVIPDGTYVVAVLDAGISTNTNRSGDRFSATTVGPILVGRRTVVSAGARIHGILRDVQASGRIGGRAGMTLIYQGIVDLKGTNHAILALPLRLLAASRTRGGAANAGAGEVPGATAPESDGATLGASVGTLFLPANSGDAIELAAGQRLGVWTTSPTSVGVATLH